jgi:hypothetical protein
VRPIAGLVLLLITACSQSDVSEYQLVYSSALQIFEPGILPPTDCTAVGTVAIAQTEPSFVARHFGYAEEEFHRSLHAQIEPLEANLLIPNEGSDVFESSSSGRAFSGAVYRCP